MLYIHPFTGDGSTKLFSIPSRIINERHVEVYVNVTGGTITNSNLLPAEDYDIAFNSIVFKDAPTEGAAIQVRTATNPDELLEPLTALQAVAASLAQIQEVADNISGVIATGENINSVNVVANNISGIIATGNISGVIATGENIDSVNVVADNISGVIATGENIDKVNIVGMDLQGSGYSNVIDMGHITDPAESLPSGISNIETVADNIDSVNVVATNISGVIALEAKLDAVVNAEANALLAQTKAGEASESADEASASELAASQSALAAAQSETNAGLSELAASQSALAAAQSETNAGLSELAAQGYANDAKDSELLAKDWASKGYGEEVEAGLYSAKHYAILAKAAVGGSIEIDMLADVTIDTPIDGQVLTYDSTIGEWVNKPLFVETNGTVQDGDILRYNATTQRYELYKLTQLLENVDMGYIS